MQMANKTPMRVGRVPDLRLLMHVLMARALDRLPGPNHLREDAVALLVRDLILAVVLGLSLPPHDRRDDRVAVLVHSLLQEVKMMANQMIVILLEVVLEVGGVHRLLILEARLGRGDVRQQEVAVALTRGRIVVPAPGPDRKAVPSYYGKSSIL